MYAAWQNRIGNHSTQSHTIIRARRLVMAIEPTAANTAPFDLDTTEKSIFDQGKWSVVHTGIISHPALPVNGVIYNLPATAIDGNDYALPEPPFVDYFEVSSPPPSHPYCNSRNLALITY